MAPHLAIPERHPYVALTPADLTRARERVERYPWARQALANLRDDADGSLGAPWTTLPKKGDTAHWDRASRLLSVALAYAFTTEPRYATWVRDGLLAYADLYPTLELTNQRCRLFSQSPLYEAMWFVPAAQAYDLVADSGLLDPEQRRHIEADLLRAGMACFVVRDFQNDARIKDLHYRCYNFQAWHLAAVGLVGLALRDPELIAYAMDSPYGLRHLISHDIREDGLFWERSVGYSQFVLSALLPLTEALLRSGVDVYSWRVPNERHQAEDAHYVTDVSDQPKSLHLLFEGPLYLAFPDSTYPALGDSDRGPLRATWTHLLGYQRYRDPRLGWLLRRDLPLGATDLDRGLVGFLHYYRFQYRYEQVRLNGQPVRWQGTDAVYEATGDTLLARDQGARQTDHYLLSTEIVADAVLEWTMTRLADSGTDDRAWVVYHLDPGDTGTRKSFSLASLCPEVNRPYAFRLVTAGGDARLQRDGQEVATKPSVYRHAPDWHWLVYDPPQVAEPVPPEGTPWTDGAFGNTGVFRHGCSLFPASGVVVLRQAGADFATQRDTTAVALSAGPHGGGHGHSDQLTLTLYAQGRQWLPDFGSMPYETSWKAEWTAQTISHNTLVIDGVSQRPTGDRDVQWPTDSAQDRVCGRVVRFAPEQKSATVADETAYAGMAMERSLRLAGACAIDHLSARPVLATAPVRSHRFDYVLHVDGEFVEASVPLEPRTGPLGERCGYQHVEQTHAAALTQTVALTYRAGEGRLRVWLVPVSGAASDTSQLILAKGLTNQPTGRTPMVVVRCEAPAASFVTVLEPVPAEGGLTAVRLATGPGDGALELLMERGGAQERVPLPTGTPATP